MATPHLEPTEEADVVIPAPNKRKLSPLSTPEEGERKRRRPLEREDSDKLICYNCTGTGHLARDCPQPSSVMCYLCNKLGHFAKYCPERVKQLERDLALERSKNTFASYYYGYGAAASGYEAYPPPTPAAVPAAYAKHDKKACYNCGGDGHLARYCPTPRHGFSSNPPAHETPAVSADSAVLDYSSYYSTYPTPSLSLASASTTTPTTAATSYLAYPGYDFGITPAAVDTSIKCFNCNGFGHFAKNCSQQGRCYNCGQSGHIGKECPVAGQRTCFICHKPGHLSAQCPNRMCYNCGSASHISTECPAPSTMVCHLCKRVGHKANKCPSMPQAPRYPTATPNYTDYAHLQRQSYPADTKNATSHPTGAAAYSNHPYPNQTYSANGARGPYPRL